MRGENEKIPLIRLRHLLPEYREKAVCWAVADEFGPLPVLGERVRVRGLQFDARRGSHDPAGTADRIPARRDQPPVFDSIQKTGG
jgi:hypothetical protein